jgi:hypothetical protein
MPYKNKADEIKQRRRRWLRMRPAVVRRYKSRKRRGVCTNCGSRPRTKTLRCGKCRDYLRRYSIAFYRRVRDEAFAAYGGAICKCCGETGREFLTLDPIRNDGAKHRALMNSTLLAVRLKRLGFPRGFRVLCFNCNIARNSGRCPHASAR